MSNVVSLARRDPRGRVETIELDSVEDACRLLQRELAFLVFSPGGRKVSFYKLAAQVGLSSECIAKIAYGVTRWPRLKTCIVLFQALGYKVLLQR
jgi:hypothetical protein